MLKANCIGENRNDDGKYNFLSQILNIKTTKYKWQF